MHPIDITQLREKQRRKTKIGRPGLLIIQVEKGEAPYEAILERSSLSRRGHMSVHGSHQEAEIIDAYHSFLIRPISTVNYSVSQIMMFILIHFWFKL